MQPWLQGYNSSLAGSHHFEGELPYRGVILVNAAQGGDLSLRHVRLAAVQVGQGQVAVHFRRACSQILRLLQGVYRLAKITRLQFILAPPDLVMGRQLLACFQCRLVLHGLLVAALFCQQAVQG